MATSLEDMSKLYGALAKGEVLIETNHMGESREISGSVALDLNNDYRVKPAVPTLWVTLDESTGSIGKVYKNKTKAQEKDGYRLVKFQEVA